jgi:hypothetical protein
MQRTSRKTSQLTLRGEKKIIIFFNFTLVFLNENLSSPVTNEIRFCLFNSGWNTENSPQQQSSPTNNQQIPPLGQQQQFGAGNFRGNNRFPIAARGGRGRGANNNTAWNPHMQGPAGPVGIIPPNLNQPPPKMVRNLRRNQSKFLIFMENFLYRNCGWKQKQRTENRTIMPRVVVKRLGTGQTGRTSKS